MPIECTILALVMSVWLCILCVIWIYCGPVCSEAQDSPAKQPVISPEIKTIADDLRTGNGWVHDRFEWTMTKGDVRVHSTGGLDVKVDGQWTDHYVRHQRYLRRAYFHALDIKTGAVVAKFHDKHGEKFCHECGAKKHDCYDNDFGARLTRCD